MVAMRRPATAAEGVDEHCECFDLRNVQQTPADRRLTGSRRTTKLVHEQTLATIQYSIVVGLGESCDPGIPEFDKAPVRDRKSNSCAEIVGHSRSYIHVELCRNDPGAILDRD